MRFFLPFFSFFLNFFPLPLLLPSLPSFLPFMAGRLTVVRLYATSPPAFIAIDCVFDCHQFVLGAGPTPFTGRSRPFATFDVPVVSFLPNPRDRTDLFVSLCDRPSLPPPPPLSLFFFFFFLINPNDDGKLKGRGTNSDENLFLRFLPLHARKKKSVPFGPKTFLGPFLLLLNSRFFVTLD